jgi:exopolyphosphatase/guanosine-5'-triphosphate,3'-diphosphate pyrophosphatase
MLGLALCSAFGGANCFDERIAVLCSPAERKRAHQWGLAIRLAQRLSGGVAEPLRDTILRRDERRVLLSLPGDCASLAGEAVARRHKHLAVALGLEAVLA